MRAQSLRSCLGLRFALCLILCNPMDYSPPGSSVHGILQARILEWAVMPSSRGSSRARHRTTKLLCFLHWQAGSLPVAALGKSCMHSKQRQFYSFFSSLYSFYLIFSSALTTTSNTVLNNSGESGHPCLVPHLRGNAVSFSPPSITLAESSVGKELTAMQETWVQFLGREDPVEKG